MAPHDLVGAVLALGQPGGEPLGQALAGAGRAGAALHVAQGLDQPRVQPVLPLDQRLRRPQEAPVRADQALLQGRDAVELGDRRQRPRRLLAPAREVEGARGDHLQAGGDLGRVAAAGQQPADRGGQVAQGLRVDEGLQALPEQARRRGLAHPARLALRREARVEAEERRPLEGAEVGPAAVGRLDGADAERRAAGEVRGGVAGGAEVLHQRPQPVLAGGPGGHAAAIRARASASAPSAMPLTSSTRAGSAQSPRWRVPASETTPTRRAWRRPISATE